MTNDARPTRQPAINVESINLLLGGSLMNASYIASKFVLRVKTHSMLIRASLFLLRELRIVIIIELLSREIWFFNKDNNGDIYTPWIIRKQNKRHISAESGIFVARLIMLLLNYT